MSSLVVEWSHPAKGQIEAYHIKELTLFDKLGTFAYISDTHLHADRDYIPYAKEGVPHPAYPQVRQLIDFINNFEAEIDFVVHTGDVMHCPANAEEYREPSQGGVVRGISSVAEIVAVVERVRLHLGRRGCISLWKQQTVENKLTVCCVTR